MLKNTNLSQQQQQQQQKRSNYLLSEPNYHTTKFSTKNLLPVQMKKSRDTYE